MHAVVCAVLPFWLPAPADCPSTQVALGSTNALACLGPTPQVLMVTERAEARARVWPTPLPSF